MHSINGSTTPKDLKGSWRTPQALFDYLNKIYNFNLDAYASGSNALCVNYITAEDNAHLVDWREFTNGDPVVAFCNPEYVQPNIKLCLEAARREARRGGTVVVVIPNQPANYWETLVVGQANHITITLGRISFIDPVSGDPIQGNPGGSAIITYAPRAPRTRRVATGTSYVSVYSMMSDA